MLVTTSPQIEQGQKLGGGLDSFNDSRFRDGFFISVLIGAFSAVIPLFLEINRLFDMKLGCSFS